LGDRTIGALIVFFPHNRHFTEQQIELTYALAQQVTLAIQLTRLAEEAKQAAIAREQEKAAQERAAELAKANEVLARTSSRLAEQPDLSGFLGHIMLEAVAQIGADGGHLTTYDPQQEMISTAVLVEQGKVISSLDFPPDMPISEVGFIQLIRETRQLRYFDLEANFEQDSHLLWQDVGEHHKRRDHVVGIAIPLFIGDEFLGHFGLAFTSKKIINEQNIELLQVLANQAALAIQLTRLAEEAKQAAIAREQEKAAQERAAELVKANEALKRTVSKLSEQPELDAFLNHVLTEAAEQIGACSNALFLYNAATHTLSMHAICLHGQIADILTDSRLEPYREPIPADISPAWRQICETGWVVAHETDGTDPNSHPQSPSFHRAMGHETVVAVPLVVGGRTIGFMAPCFREWIDPNPEKIELVQSLAHQATLALELTRLAEEAKQAAIAREQEKAAQERAAELVKANEALKRSLNQLANDRNLESFLERILQEAIQTLDGAAAQLFLYDAKTHTISPSLGVDKDSIIRPEPGLVSGLPIGQPFSADVTGAWQRLLGQRSPIYFDIERDSADHWPGAIEFHRSRGEYGSVCTALMLGDQPLGILGLAFHNRTQFKASEFEFFQALAQQATLAIQLTQLAEEAKQVAVLEERNRMAREIHDTIAQGLAGILIQLQAAEDTDLTDAGDRQAHIAQARHLAAASLAEARRSVRALRPQVLEETNLAGALTSLMRDLTSNTELQVTYRVQGTPYVLSTEIETNLLRIAQEAMNNILKHAEATHIQIELNYRPDHVQLQIQDNGQGFDYDQLTHLETSKKGYGLISMQERSQQIGGNLTIASQPGEGTVLTIVVPLTL
uniref:GAF domain-containing protein n=1 Tax=Oscillatoria sp. FACHB-1407 TaxID=2692847 RepID=UPI0016830CA2